MIYMADVTTPVGATEEAPHRTVLKVTKGLVYKFHLYMPHGAMGMHYVQVYDGSFQLWPTTTGRAFRGDGIQVDWDDIYFKSSEPFEFQIRTWNTDTVYEHGVIIGVGMVSEEAFMARYLPGMSWEKMTEFLKQLQATQEAARTAEEAAVLAAPFPWLVPAGGEGT